MYPAGIKIKIEKGTFMADVSRQTLRTGSIIFFILLYLLAFSNNSVQAGPKKQMTYTKISAATAHQMMQDSNKFILLDVRTEAEFLDKRIAGAILIPDFELEKRADSELPDLSVQIFVYCRSGVRSANASGILAKKGYSQVYDFGGINSWPYATISGK